MTTPRTICARALLAAWFAALAPVWLAGCQSVEPLRAMRRAGPAKLEPTPPPQVVTRLPRVETESEVRLVSAVDTDAGAVTFAAEPAARPEPVPTGPATPVQLAPVPPRASNLSLFDAIETALVQNPDLTTLRQTEGVSLGALGVARTYPFNPFLQVQVTPGQNNVAAPPTSVAHYVLVQQTLQLAHQQRRREEIAMAALSAVRWNILQAELLNMAQTQRLFFTAQYLHGVRDLAKAAAELNDELLAISERQLAAGQAAAADVAIVRLDARSARQQAQLAEANYQTALLDLRRHLGLPLCVPLDVIGGLSNWRWGDPSATGLLAAPCPDVPLAGPTDPQAIADLVSGRPDVLAARADLAAARANMGLARANRVPDFIIGPYYAKNEGNTEYWGLRAQSDMPIWNNGVPMVRQRQAEVRQRHTAWQQLQVRAEIEAQAAIDRYERARLLVTGIKDDDVNSLPRELQRLEAQFKANEVDVVRVVTARTSLLQARRAQLDLLNEVAQAAAAVTAATGLAPQTLITPAPAP